MRRQLSEELPFPLVAKELPLVDSSGAVVMGPTVCIEDLVSLVMHFIELNDAAGTLVWPATVPKEEVWVKIGGDHGGQSFKLCFELVNVTHPNALCNTIPFLVFAVKDSPTNLHRAFAPYIDQVKTLQDSKWRDKHIKVSLFGDYDFMTKCYGLSGSSGVRPCLFCLMTKTEMQSTHTPQSCTPRSIQGLREDLERFKAAGSRLQNANHYNNVIREVIFPIAITDVCVPVLHLDLGIFPWLYEAMIRDAEDIDFLLAKCQCEHDAASSSFKEIAEKHAQVRSLSAEKDHQQQQLHVAEAQLQYTLVNAQLVQNQAVLARNAALAVQLQQQWHALQQEA